MLFSLLISKFEAENTKINALFMRLKFGAELVATQTFSRIAGVEVHSSHG